jgi:diguanylate cyclase (GGDEF)-like protein
MIRDSGEHTKEVELRDLESTNGTYHNGGKITRALLKNGDKIRIGSTVLMLSLSDREESAYHARLFELAIRDAHTGLYNRRYLLQTLKTTFTVVKRNRRDLGLIIFDIDDFKQINDRYGHIAGDEYLRIIGGVLKNSLREQDVCGRYGGEEFILLLPETGLTGTRRVGEKIRSRVEQLKVPYQNREMRTTISGGIACYKPSVASAEDLIAQADRALYQAKFRGKNRVCV